MNTVLKINRQLFSTLNKLEIPYCHWKSNEHLKEGLDGTTDLDVLFSDTRKNDIISALNNAGYIKVLSQYGSRYPGVEDWIGVDPETGVMSHVHLHYKLVTGHMGLKEYELPWKNELLESRIFNDEFDIYISEPNYELMTLFTRAIIKMPLLTRIKTLFGNYHMPKDYKVEIDYLITKVNKKTLKEICTPYFKNDTDKLIDLFFSPSFDIKWYRSIQKIIHKSIDPCRRNKSLFLLVMRIWYRFIIKSKSALRKFTDINVITKKRVSVNGKMIAFIGQDGAGKSTVTDEIINWLTWKLDAKKFYLGSGDHYHSWQKTLRSVLGNPNNKIIKKFCDLLTLSDLIKQSKRTCRILKKAKKYCNNGGIAIFDRYPQNQFGGINDGPKIQANIKEKKLPGFLVKYVKTMADKEEKNFEKAVKISPDLLIKLTLPPEESIRRKPQESLENVKIKHEVVKSLHYDGAKEITIDATMPYKDEIVQIHNAIWEIIVRGEIPD